LGEPHTSSSIPLRCKRRDLEVSASPRKFLRGPSGWKQPFSIRFIPKAFLTRTEME
jgi:hypothetical protein